MQALSLIVIFIGALAGQIASGEQGTSNWSIISLVCISVAYVFQVTQNGVSERALGQLEARDDATERRATVIYNDTLDPLISTLGKLLQDSTKPGKREKLAEIRTAVLTAAASKVGPPERVRAGWFPVSTDQGSQIMRCDKHVGRSDAPVTTFTAGDPWGDFVFALLTADKPYLCADTLEETHPGFVQDDERKYRTFSVIPVVVGSEAFGVITVDALESHSISDEDVTVLVLLARILGAAMTYAGR